MQEMTETKSQRQRQGDVSKEAGGDAPSQDDRGRDGTSVKDLRLEKAGELSGSCCKDQQGHVALLQPLASLQTPR